MLVDIWSMEPRDPNNQFPMCDAPITLPSGTIVRVRNRIAFKTQGITSLTIYIESPTPPEDSAKLAREARELVEMHSEYADSVPLIGIGVAVCRTPAQVGLRENPPERLAFRREDGEWVSE